MKVIIYQGGDGRPIVNIEGDTAVILDDKPEKVAKAYLEIQKILKEAE